MKKLSISLIFVVVFLGSCQVQADNFATPPKVYENTEKSKELTPIVSLTPTTKTISDINTKVGIADVTDEKIICFRIKNANLSEGESVSIITSISEFPQKVLETTVEKKLEKSCVSHDSDTGDSNVGKDSYYSLILNDKNSQNSEVGIGIGIIQLQKKARVQNNLARVDLNEDGKAEFFRLCASNEGLHLTIWTGKPLIGKRIWHYYYYLHYDTVADCKKKDYEETED